MASETSPKCELMWIVLAFSTNDYIDGSLWLLFAMTASLLSGFAVHNLMFTSHQGMNAVYKDLLSVLFLTDFLQASLMFPLFAWSSFEGYPFFCFDKPGINVLTPVLTSLKFLSILTIFMLTLNLYLQVTYPLVHWVTRERRVWFGFLALTASFAIGVGAITASFELPRVGAVYLITIVFASIVIHVRTIIRVQNQTNVVHHEGPREGSHIYSIRNSNCPSWVKRTVATLSWFIGCLISLTIVPALILTVMSRLGTDSTSSRIIKRLLVKVIICNHYANFGLYFWRNRSIQKSRQDTCSSLPNNDQ